MILETTKALVYSLALLSHDFLSQVALDLKKHIEQSSDQYHCKPPTTGRRALYWTKKSGFAFARLGLLMLMFVWLALNLAGGLFLLAWEMLRDWITLILVVKLLFWERWEWEAVREMVRDSMRWVMDGGKVWV
ncbi:hypothetical protein BO94DRAFT_587876 [Aspergillus sclerotioniger CBS 115572]|uniref:Uncharacterized protein n=1 Tax=Aspergillus sclerotioniger CBS 115572 TaxID=1450535 RepID=A0A317W1A9_9EURO|nr:hypothetical protein BO94DRAFT_587876 [Aspergillus sclerotioniger CBS 115572]PWY80426.1 hypothetical protein BO94DRAFT_587876 [Aspergillus sclerotioniger CBS 115572]